MAAMNVMASVASLKADTTKWFIKRQRDEIDWLNSEKEELERCVLGILESIDKLVLRSQEPPVTLESDVSKRLDDQQRQIDSIRAMLQSSAVTVQPLKVEDVKEESGFATVIGDSYSEVMEPLIERVIQDPSKATKQQQHELLDANDI